MRHLFDPCPTMRPEPVHEPISYTAEVARKALHLLALLVPAGVLFFGSKSAAVIPLAALATLAVTGDVLRVRAAWFRRFIDATLGFMIREEERPPLGGRVQFNGATWVLLSILVLVVVFPIRLAVPIFAVFMVSDAAAALVGRRFGRHPWPRGRGRTVEGTLGFLATFFVLAWGCTALPLCPPLVFWTLALSGLVAAALEALPIPVNDNFRVPFGTAIVLSLLERYALDRRVELFF